MKLKGFKLKKKIEFIFSSVQSLTRVRFFATPWIAGCNLHVVKHTHFKCALGWVLTSLCLQSTTLPHHQDTEGLHCPESSQCPLSVHRFLPTLAAGNHWSALLLWISFACSRISGKWNHAACNLCVWLLSASCFWSSSTLLCVASTTPFLLLSSIPRREYAQCLYLALLWRDIWFVSSLELLRDSTFMNFCMWRFVLMSLK